MSSVIELTHRSFLTEMDTNGAEVESTQLQITPNKTSANSSEAKSQDSQDPSIVTLIDGERFNRPFMKVKVSLKTNAATQIVLYNFRRLNSALDIASGFMSRFGTEEEVQGFFKMVNEIFDQREEEIREAYKGARALLTSKGFDGTRAEYSTTHTLEVPYNTQLSLRFLRIAQDFDEFMTLVDTCWLSSVITEDEYKKFVSEWEIRLSDSVKNLFREQQRIVIDINERRGKNKNAGSSAKNDGQRAHSETDPKPKTKPADDLKINVIQNA